MIAHTVSRLDLMPTCERLSFPLGAAMDVSGKVRKLVMREAQMKLVIEPDDVSGFVVFADCLPDAENLRKHKIWKGSAVAVRGKLQTFGASAICLSDCRLQ